MVVYYLGSAFQQRKNGLYGVVQIESDAFNKNAWGRFGGIESQKVEEF
jgi:hypothetical protein